MKTTRVFGGELNHPNKAIRNAEKKHLKAYLKGKKTFTYKGNSFEVLAKLIEEKS